MRHPFINNGPLLFSLTVLLLLAALVYGSTIEDTTLSHQQQRILRGEVKTKEVIHPRIQDNDNNNIEEITQGYFTTYQATTTPLQCPTELSNVITIDDESQLYYSIVAPPSSSSNAAGSNNNNNDSGILCGRLEVTNNNGGWVGLAISQNGKMFGSEAIIGVPNDALSIDGGGGATVKKYYLGGYTVGYEVGGWGVYYMDEDKQTLTDTSLTEDINDDGNDVTIMTFTKILNEDNEIPIVTNGTNIFLHARGIGQSSLGPHAGYGNVFEKDFSEDVTETPTGAPTFSPGTVFRYFCTKDQAPLDRDEYCPWIEEDGYTDFDSCDDKCGGKNKACVSTFCITETPTLSPTVSDEPTITPLPTTSDPSSSPSSSPVTPVPTVKGLTFIGGGGTTAYPTEPKFVFKPPERELSVPLSKFQLDFVVTDPEKDSSSSNNNTKRRQLLRVGGEEAGTTITSRQLENDDEEYVFQSTQDSELLTLVSNHLLDQFTLNVDGTPSIVELGIDTKSQQDMGSGKVMVSYNYIGYAVYPSSKEAPSTAELDNEVLNSFNTRQGKGAFASSLQYTEDPLLKRIVNVIASSSASTNEASNPSKVINDKVDAGSVVDNNTGGNSSTAIAVPIVVLIASIFAILIIIGFFTLRKYHIRYLENNANNDYVNYQNRKKKKKINSGKKVKKKYDYFDSPNGSVMSQSEDPIYTDLEIVGGDTFPMSQDSSDADPQSPVAQFNPNDTALPYDEAQDVSGTAAVYDMTHFAHESYQMEEKVDEETLAGLYSDKDSYFQGSSTLASGQHHRQGHQHGDGDSVHSFDTLESNTFGFQSHLIEDIDKIIQNNEQELKQEKDGPVKEEELDQFITEFTGEKSGVLETSFASSTAEMRHIGEVVLEENSDDTDGPVISIDGAISPSDAYEEEEEEERGDIISIDGVISYGNDEDSDEDEDENENIISIDGIITRRSDTDEEESVMLAEVEENDSQEDDMQNTSGESSTSATDQLFARIAELETKIMNTESQLSQDDSVHLISPPVTSPRSKEETSTFPKGMFTDQTLSMIEQSRLAGTPPPSEGEVDNEMITQAKNNTLLGRYLDESESEEDSVFE